MKRVTLTVSDEVADALRRLARYGSLPSRVSRKRARNNYRAFELARYAEPDEWTKSRLIEIDGKAHFIQKSFSYGGAGRYLKEGF